MIRLWKGIEKEGIGVESEIMTLFICADVPISFGLIRKTLEDNPDIKGLYFGAGRLEFEGMNAQDWDRVVIYCDANNISIIIEVNPMLLIPFTHLYNAPIVTFIVAYYNAPKNINKLYFKTDDFAVTTIYTSQKDVDITSVVDNRYPDDVILYEED